MARKRTGRPKGSKTKNITQGEVYDYPSRCPKCDSTEHQVVQFLREMNYRGVNPDGKPYDSICKRRVRCKACGRYYLKSSYRFSGDGSFLTKE